MPDVVNLWENWSDRHPCDTPITMITVTVLYIIIYVRHHIHLSPPACCRTRRSQIYCSTPQLNASAVVKATAPTFQKPFAVLQLSLNRDSCAPRHPTFNAGHKYAHVSFSHLLQCKVLYKLQITSVVKASISPGARWSHSHGRNQCIWIAVTFLIWV